jgi:hypothetical protein
VAKDKVKDTTPEDDLLNAVAPIAPPIIKADEPDKPSKERTVIEKPDKLKKAKREKISFSLQEVEQKLFLLFAGIAKVSGRINTFTEADFDSEARGILRLAEKFEAIYDALKFLDPVLIIIGLVTKFTAMKKVPVKVKTVVNGTETA